MNKHFVSIFVLCALVSAVSLQGAALAGASGSFSRTNAAQLKAGSCVRGERIAKYNRLLSIEDELLSGDN